MGKTLEHFAYNDCAIITLLNLRQVETKILLLINAQVNEVNPRGREEARKRERKRHCLCSKLMSCRPATWKPKTIRQLERNQSGFWLDNKTLSWDSSQNNLFAVKLTWNEQETCCQLAGQKLNYIVCHVNFPAGRKGKEREEGDQATGQVNTIAATEVDPG